MQQYGASKCNNTEAEKSDTKLVNVTLQIREKATIQN